MGGFISLAQTSMLTKKQDLITLSSFEPYIVSYISSSLSLSLKKDLRITMAALIVDAEYLKEIDKARRELRALIAKKNCAPIMLRLA